MKNCWNCGQLFTGFLQECPQCRQIKAIKEAQASAEKAARDRDYQAPTTRWVKPKLTDEERFDADGNFTLDGLFESWNEQDRKARGR